MTNNITTSIISATAGEKANCADTYGNQSKAVDSAPDRTKPTEKNPLRLL